MPDQRRKYLLGRRLRLRRRNDFQRLFGSSLKAWDRRLTLYVAPNGLAGARLGVAVSPRRAGAAARNRLKRLCREAFRLIRHELPVGWDYMAVPRAGREITLSQIQDSLRSLAGRLTAAGGEA